MQYNENSISKHVQKFPKLKIAEPRRLATQPVRGSKNRLLAGFKFLTNPLKLLAVIITAMSAGHVTGIITLMPIAHSHDCKKWCSSNHVFPICNCMNE